MKLILSYYLLLYYICRCGLNQFYLECLYHLMKLGSQVKSTYSFIQTNQVNSSHFSKILHYSSDYTKFSIYHHNKMKFFFYNALFFLVF